MSNLEDGPETRCGGQVALADPPVLDWLDGRDVPLGPRTTVRRLLPHQTRRMVGAWCFLDHFGPENIAGRRGMAIGPHPHTGIQTVSWLLSGEVLHRDSLGSEQLVQPGQLNLMTAGSGIAHSEESPADHSAVMHGLQLWVALPEASRATAARFDHLPSLPALDFPSADRPGVRGARGRLVMGEMDGARSAAPAFSELIGLDVRLFDDGRVRLPLERDFEYAVLATSGASRVAGVPLRPGALLYLGRGRDGLEIESLSQARRVAASDAERRDQPTSSLESQSSAESAPSATGLFLLGGAPFEEELVMWWNFVARSHEEIVQARRDWAEGSSRFGVVRGFGGPALAAPALPTTTLLPRSRHGRSAS